MPFIWLFLSEVTCRCFGKRFDRCQNSAFLTLQYRHLCNMNVAECLSGPRVQSNSHNILWICCMFPFMADWTALPEKYEQYHTMSTKANSVNWFVGIVLSFCVSWSEPFRTVNLLFVKFFFLFFFQKNIFNNNFAWILNKMNFAPKYRLLYVACKGSECVNECSDQQVSALLRQFKLQWIVR